MEFHPRRPVIKAIQFVWSDRSSMFEIGALIEAVTRSHVKSLSLSTLVGCPPSLIIVVDGKDEPIVMCQSEWLCFEEDGSHIVLSPTDFARAYERVGSNA